MVKFSQSGRSPRDCVIQLEVPLVFKGGEKDIVEIAKTEFGRDKCDINSKVITDEDIDTNESIDTNYVSIRPQCDRFNARLFTSFYNKYMGNTTDKYREKINSIGELNNITEFLSHQIVSSYGGMFWRVVSPEDPLETDIGFYNTGLEPQLVASIKTTRKMPKGRLKEKLMSESSRFWRNEPPRIPILGHEDSPFDEVSITHQNGNSIINMYGNEAGSLKEMSLALESFFVGGSNRSDVSADDVVITCRVK